MSKNINSNNKNQPRDVTAEVQRSIRSIHRSIKSKVEDLKVAGKVKDHTQITGNRKNIDIYIRVSSLLKSQNVL